MPHKESPFKIFLAVQKALFLRELNTQFSVSRSGMFWTFFKPFMQVLVFIIIKYFIFGGVSGYYDFAVFLALNFTAFNMFTGIVMGSLGAFEANKALFSYKQVKPIDAIVARTLVQVFFAGVVYMMFLFIGYYFGFGMDNKNIGMVIVALLWLIVFSFSFALLIAIGNLFYKSIGNIFRFTTMGLMFASAVFYPLASLPHDIQEILAYNPLALLMEMLHGFYFYALDDRFVDYRYLAEWTVVPLFVGLWLYVRLEKKIVSQ